MRCLATAVKVRDYNIVRNNETCLNENTSDNDFHLEDNTIYMKVRTSEGRINHGCVLIAFIKKPIIHI